MGTVHADMRACVRAEETGSCLQIRRKRLDSFPRCAWHVWMGLLYVPICLGGAEGGVAERGPTPEIPELLNIPDSSLAGFSKQTRRAHYFSNALVALGGHATQPFPTPPRLPPFLCPPPPPKPPLHSPIPKEQLFWLRFHVVKANSHSPSGMTDFWERSALRGQGHCRDLHHLEIQTWNLE